MTRAELRLVLTSAAITTLVLIAIAAWAVVTTR